MKKFIERENLNESYNVNISQLQYNTILSSIPQVWKENLVHDQVEPNKIQKTLFESINMKPQTEVKKYIYKLYQSQTKGNKFDLKKKWEKYLLNADLENSKHFLIADKLTLDAHLRSFHFKILHRIVWFNDKLFKYGLSNSTMCSFCFFMLDSMEHRFWSCGIVQEIWKDVMEWFEDSFDYHISLTIDEVMLNYSKTTMSGLIILMTKYHIYRAFLKNTKPNIHKLKQEILLLEKFELTVALRKNLYQTHKEKWKRLCSG